MYIVLLQSESLTPHLLSIPPVSTKTVRTVRLYRSLPFILAFTTVRSSSLVVRGITVFFNIDFFCNKFATRAGRTTRTTRTVRTAYHMNHSFGVHHRFYRSVSRSLPVFPVSRTGANGLGRNGVIPIIQPSNLN